MQAVLQSLPQIILLAISLSSMGPAHSQTEPDQCDVPHGAIIAALAVASLNVLDKLAQSGLQVHICVCACAYVRMSVCMCMSVCV